MSKLRWRSASKLSTFRDCPAMYHFKYMQKLPDEVGTPAKVGKAFHLFAEAYVNGLVESERQSDWETITPIFESLRGKFSDVPASEIPRLRDLCIEWAQRTIIDPSAVAGVELTIPDNFRERMDRGEWSTFTANLGNDFVYVGIIDRVDVQGKSVIITDYKTGYQVKSVTELAKDPQVRYYPWAVSKEFPGEWERFVVRMEYVSQGITREIEIDPADLPDIERDLLAECEAVDAGPYDPRPGSACSYCSFTAQCPAFAKIPAIVRPPVNDEEAKKMAGDLVLLKQRVKEWEELLKGWCGVNGTVNANGVAYGFWPRGGARVKDAKALAGIIGEDAWKLLSVSATSLKPYLRKHPEYADAVAAISVEDKTTAFKSKKAGEEE